MTVPTAAALPAFRAVARRTTGSAERLTTVPLPRAGSMPAITADLAEAYSYRARARPETVASPLTELSRALVLTSDEELGGSLRESLAGGRIERVEVVPTPEDALEILADAPDVGSVIVTDRLEAPLAALERIEAHDEQLPQCYYAESGDGTEAWRATAAGADAYVPSSVSADEFADHLDAQFDRYGCHRWRDARSEALSTVLDVVPGSLYVKDHRARHLVKSSVQGDVSEAEAIGKTDRELYDDEDSYQEEIDLLGDGESVVDRESQFEAPDGTRWLRTTKRPWRDEDGSIRGLVGWTVDATEEIERDRRIEEQDRRLDAVADTFAHDLRSPLQLASGYLARARETGDPSDFDDVEDALGRIDEMLGDLRSLVDKGADDVVDAGEFLPATPLVRLARDVWDLVATDAASLVVEAPETARIHLAPTVLRPVLENLFKNAVTHAGEGVTVHVGVLADGGFYVADDGPGIPPEEREAVRQRGYTTAGDGSGIGLSLVDEIAADRGWEFAILESTDGGARFEIRHCPVVANPPDEPGATTNRSIETFEDVGTVRADSRAEYDDETDRWTVAGGGRAIVDSINEFHFAAATVEPPVRIQGRLVEFDGPTEWSTAALLLREDVSEDAAYCGIGRAQGRGVCTLWRPRGDEGNWMDYRNSDPSYDRFRLQLRDGVATASIAADGAEWIPFDQRRLSIEGELLAGMAVCSTLRDEAATGTFESVTVSELDFEDA